MESVSAQMSGWAFTTRVLFVFLTMLLVCMCAFLFDQTLNTYAQNRT